MTDRNDTSSIRAVMTAVALSALSLTTTINTSGMMYNDVPAAVAGNDFGTMTPFPKTGESKIRTAHEFAREVFGNHMRDFTKEEAEIYQASLKKIYKPTGVNILDLC